jgi:hypothetical protein
MVNARNISLAALASVVVIAVVGVETYKSGNYRTQINFHATLDNTKDLTIERAQVFGESATTCGNLGRATKGDEVACLEANDTTTEAKIEMNNGFIYAMKDGDVALFLRLDEGLYPIFTDAQANIEVPEATEEGQAPTVVRDRNGQIQSIEGDIFKIQIDSIVNGAAAQHIDFSEEEEASGRALLATRGVRGRKAAWWKKTNNWRKKKAKKIACAGAIALMLAWIIVCIIAACGAAWATLGILAVHAMTLCLFGMGGMTGPPGLSGIWDNCSSNHCELKGWLGLSGGC